MFPFTRIPFGYLFWTHSKATSDGLENASGGGDVQPRLQSAGRPSRDVFSRFRAYRLKNKLVVLHGLYLGMSCFKGFELLEFRIASWCIGVVGTQDANLGTQVASCATCFGRGEPFKVDY